jgi:predicted ATPase
MDTQSWSLLLAMVQQVAGIFIVLSTRPMPGNNRILPWIFIDISKEKPFQYSQLLHVHRCKYLELEPLEKKETAELICQLLNVQVVPDKITDDIHKKSQGNPFLTLEMVYALRDSGCIQTKGEKLVMTNDALQAVPE